MFEGLLSNTRMKTELAHAISENRPMHAYLFCGAKGSGKLTAAKMLATELVGGDRGKAGRGTHPDIFILEPEKNKRLITVEQVRNMRNDAFINPSEALRKIYIINGVHLMNDAGQNALLTILEQPPSFAIFILLSESREKVLSTVISRCAVFEMEYVEAQEGAEFLSKKLPDIPFEKLVTSMNASDGNVGVAMQFASSEDFAKGEQQCVLIAKAMAVKDCYTLAKIFSGYTKDTLPEFLPLVAMFLKDIIVARLSGGSKLVFRDSVLQNESAFDKIDINILYNSVMECENAMKLIDGNVNIQLITAALVIRFCGGKQID